jgi:hypothetical protein
MAEGSKKPARFSRVSELVRPSPRAVADIYVRLVDIYDVYVSTLAGPPQRSKLCKKAQTTFMSQSINLTT